MNLIAEKKIFEEFNKFWKGLVVGLVIITPISGGTMLLVLGLYEELMRDISSFKIFTWLSFGFGSILGIFLSGRIFATLFNSYTLLILGFLLGCILASIRAVLGDDYHLTIKRLIVLGIGLVIGLFLADLSDFGAVSQVSPNNFTLVLGGALSSAAMIIPGVPGGTILILMGIYDDTIMALGNFDWSVLIIFALGAFAGIIGLSNIFNRIYSQYRAGLSWFFVGLIFG
ncbi:MAG: undecaprenyl phosphate translocase family protein, partial [Bacillota bacterium]